MYNTNIIESFKTFENVGDLRGSSVNTTVKSKKYGDIVKIYLKINSKLIIEDAKVKLFGGIALTVAGSALCDLVKGKSLVAAQKITSEDVLAQVNDMPEEKMYTASLVVIALMEAIKKYLKKVNKLQKMADK